MNDAAHNSDAMVKANAQQRDWRKAMSDHVAYALLVYTGLQIFITVKALADGFSSILPYASLIVLVAAIIPACRWFEKRWTSLDDEAAFDPDYAGEFRRDTIALWLLAVTLPIVFTGIVKLMIFFM